MIVKRDDELKLKLVKRDDELKLKAVNDTVQKEMKSYASVVSKSCSVALAPKKIEAAVRKVSDQQKSILVAFWSWT